MKVDLHTLSFKDKEYINFSMKEKVRLRSMCTMENG
jgi:hypothetical protein